MSPPSFTILHVEDDPDDVLLVQAAFSQCGVDQELVVARDGQEALDYLQREGAWRDRRTPLPALILLDLKLPRRSGLEVLEWLRGRPGLRRIPVVVLTSSTQPSDIDRAYDLGANAYLVKPVDAEDLRKTIEVLRAFWFAANQGPTRTNAP